jgi:hypothetical protein
MKTREGVVEMTGWIRFSSAVVLFVTSCVGLSYLANSWARRRKKSRWVGCLTSFAIALLWPAVVVAYIMYDAGRYQAEHPHDDAPGMVVASVITAGAPVLFIISLGLAFLGAALAHGRNPGAEPDSRASMRE